MYKKIFLRKPDHSVGHWIEAGLGAGIDVAIEEARRSAIEEGAGTADEVASWTAVVERIPPIPAPSSWE